ncbi:integrase catalytic domain-containing protein [Trichonephila clavipes]|nr:integrase catalytic domain-containing protein [Trichonephila clavipes]
MPPKRSAIDRSTKQAKRRREERASETKTSEQRQARQERDRIHTALARSLETNEQRQARQQRNRNHSTQTRRTIDTDLNLCGFNYNLLYNYSRESPSFHSSKGNNSSAAELLVNQATANSKCIFCGENLHDSSSYDSVSIDMKRDHLKRNKLCFFSFSGRHAIAFYPKLKKEKGCSFCGLKSHSKVLCYRFYQNNSDKTTSHSHKEESDGSMTSVSSCQSETQSQRVLLQTASVVARYNKQFRNFRLLADTAAQRSFVERKFSRLLKLPVIRKEKLSIYSFRDKSPVEKTFIVVKIRLENEDDPNSSLEIEALETGKISAAHIPPPDIDISIYNTHLKGLKLADTTNSVTNVSVSIGADNYYDVMTVRIKRISRELVADESGWCLIDDVLGGQSTVASAYTSSVECFQIFNEANMPLHKWATNSAELRELWENLLKLHRTLLVKI